MRTFSTLAAVAVALTSASVVSAAVQYTVDDLGGLGGSLGSRGSSVGSSVLVAGTSYLAGNGSVNALTSAVGGGGSVTHVAYPALSGGANSYGMGVGGSNGETLVGYAQSGNRGPYHAISGFNGVTTDLHSTIVASAPFTGGTTSRAMAINGSDTVVGQASAGSALQAFSLSAGRRPRSRSSAGRTPIRWRRRSTTAEWSSGSITPGLGITRSAARSRAASRTPGRSPGTGRQ